MSQFIGMSMPASFAGEITRGTFDHTVESAINDGTVVEFGVPVKLNAGKVAKTSAKSDVVFGFVVRNYGQSELGVQKVASVLKRGYMAVKTAGGTPAKGGQVYLKTDGTITADEGSNTAIPNCFYMGGAQDGIAEIAFNI